MMWDEEAKLDNGLVAEENPNQWTNGPEQLQIVRAAGPPR